tara:strand:- start:887 stop:2014 length:1128 start_codon:yes stop_codon:yes gene_type:complete
MGDILKEAIADAKAVRETALENAKMALEEAFTPQLKSMLSAKLKEEEEESAEEIAGVDETEDEVEETEDEVEEMAMKDEDEDAVEEDDDEEPVAETIEVNGKTYRLAEEEDEEVADEGVYEEEDEDEDKLDLESIIKELEDEIGSDDDDDDDDVSEAVEDKDNTYAEKAPADRDGLAEGEPEAADNTYAEKAPADRDGLAEGEDDEEVEIDESVFTEDEDEEEIEEQSKSSDIGKGDNKGNYASGSDEEDPGKGKLSEQLAEYKEAVVFLKNKLHEVNILNAKLLFTNKLFKEFALDNNQKLRVVETFDRAQSTREIKLVYSTLAEQFSDNGSITRKSINESASSKSGSTKPKTKKVISEEAQVANRFKKLAGII